MENDFPTPKTSNLYFPNLRVIRARKKKKFKYFLNQNNNFKFHYDFDISNEKQKINYLSINTFKLSDLNYPKTPSKTFIYHAQSPPPNPTINRYAYRISNEVNKNNNQRTITKEKINNIYFDILKDKKNSKLKSQGIVTNDIFYKRNKSKIYFRNLSLGKDENNMDNLSSFNNDMIKEIFVNKKEKTTQKKYPLTKGNTFNLYKDKYAYIYMSDKSELIKYLRRINYNPLNV